MNLHQREQDILRNKPPMLLKIPVTAPFIRGEGREFLVTYTMVFIENGKSFL